MIPLNQREVERITTTDKLGYHIERIIEYGQGKPIFPVTLELDLTTACSRRCPGCATILRPSVRSLDVSFLDSLLRYFREGTQGLLLAGGEPTLAPTFSSTLRLAHELGYSNIAVISNGAHLENEKVTQALTDHATSVRISINHSDPEDYGRSFGCEPSEFWRVLSAVEKLRSKVEKKGSPLQIGIATLTAPDNVDQLEQLVSYARNAGAHWLYFHPYCSGWETGLIKQTDQSEALKLVKSIIESTSGDFPIILFEERYGRAQVGFEGYHAAFFLLMIGGDKKIYLGAETKYQQPYEVFDLSNWQGEDFLSLPQFRAKVLSFSSRNYVPIQSRGRGVLYSYIIENVISGRMSPVELTGKARNLDLRHVHIL